MKLQTLARLALLHILPDWLPKVKASQYGENHDPVEKDEALVAAHFPDTNQVLLSPAFLTPESVLAGFANGTDGPTDDAALNDFLRSISDRNDWVHYHVAGFTSEEGRPFPYVYLSKEPLESSNGNTPKLRVWIQGGVHGNEPAGDQAVLALLGKLDANETWATSLLDRMDIMLFPRYNPDGVSYFQRDLASNLDPNREHTKLARHQSREIKQLLSSFSPHIAVDMHEFTGTRLTGSHYKHGMDALIAPGKNLNTHKDIRNMSETLFASGIAKRLEAAGFRWESYFTASYSDVPGVTLAEAGSDAKAGRNSYGLMQSIAILNEVRGIRLADQHFQRRVSTALTMVSAILDIALENVDEVYVTVENAIEQFIASNDDIIVTDYQNLTTRSVSFIDVTNGSLVQLPVNWLSTTPTIANLTRTRPEAYLIPRTWSDLAIRLQESGVIVETLDYEYRGTVEALKIASASSAQSYYEGAIQVTVTTEAYQREVHLPVGSFLISTRQKNAALAFVTLEPEGIDSYVRFNLIPVQTGDEYPIFRLLSKPAQRRRSDEL
ncbi:carboxypeptidase [Xylaria bambusicola]|uniref:carboxypeptidase n=1 Tax=Xylaria bambusicola TaxID=326684 RepID=UPI0020074039|nr:carboxypeptidase [Xylaria bambusicola]KAI0505971.1 carboxypeptidase [Xylaria bambusicola]